MGRCWARCRKCVWSRHRSAEKETPRARRVWTAQLRRLAHSPDTAWSVVWSHVHAVNAPQWLNACPLWHHQTLPLALLGWYKPASAPTSYSICSCYHHLLVLLFIHVCILATRELFKVTEIVLPLGVHWQGKDNFKVQGLLYIYFKTGKAGWQYDLHCKSFCKCNSKRSLTVNARYRTRSALVRADLEYPRVIPSTEELMLLNCGASEDSWGSLGQRGDQTSQS